MKLVFVTLSVLSCALPALCQSKIASKATIEQGLAVYRSNCAFCHGLTGGGGRGPDLVSRELVHGDTDAALRGVIKRGVPGSTMPAFNFEENEIRPLIVFLRHLRGNTPRAPVKLGDPARGKALYASGGCSGCHRIGQEGSVYGPDLSRIGVSRSIDYLRESLVHPSADIPSQYEGVTVVTKDGRKIAGIRVNEDTFSIQLRDMSQNFRLFNKEDLSEIVYQKNSMMPAYSKMSKQETDDLLAYLNSLRGDAKGGQVKRAEGIR